MERLSTGCPPLQMHGCVWTVDKQHRLVQSNIAEPATDRAGQQYSCCLARPVPCGTIALPLLASISGSLLLRAQPAHCMGASNSWAGRVALACPACRRRCPHSSRPHPCCEPPSSRSGTPPPQIPCGAAAALTRGLSAQALRPTSLPACSAALCVEGCCFLPLAERLQIPSVLCLRQPGRRCSEREVRAA